MTESTPETNQGILNHIIGSYRPVLYKLTAAFPYPWEYPLPKKRKTMKLVNCMCCKWGCHIYQRAYVIIRQLT